jgi:spermidine synthase
MRFVLLLLCFLLSGAVGLVYETLWAQQFALVFGATELAVVTVLAAYMVGLTVGAAAGGRWSRRVARPIRAYALLELGVALSALAVPAALGWVGRLQVALFGGRELPALPGSLTSTGFHLVTSLLILLVPTGLMGATLPLLARHVVDAEERLGPRVGTLYAANTLGAAAGALASAFVLLPALGLVRSLWVAVAGNVSVFLMAALLTRSAPPLAAGTRAAASPQKGDPAILPLMCVSGGVAFTLEVLWTRLVTHVLGGSLYAFATMLAAFLAGIALGSAVAARFARTAEQARHGFMAAEALVAVCSSAAFLAVGPLTDILAGRVAQGDVWAGAWMCIGTLLPVALGLGATFPFAVRLAAGGADDAGPASARVYAWNTVGAASGAIVAGLWLLPALRFAGTAAVAAGACLAMAAFVALFRAPRLWRWAAVIGVLSVAVVAVATRTPWRVLRSSGLGAPAAPVGSDEAPVPLAWPGAVTYYGVGRTATVLLTEERAGWRLTTNGLPEAVIQPPGALVGRLSATRWLSLLAVAARPSASSMLVVGLGAGSTVENLPPSLQHVEVVELEPEVVAANRFVARARRADPLADPRIRLRVDDARSALRLTGRRFDAIVSQPSHPWTGGAANLFTREFYGMVRDRLTPGGVFVQWMGLAFVDEALLKSLMATLTGTFAHVELYLAPAGGSMFLLASDTPLYVESGANAALAAGRQAFADVGVLSREDILTTRVLDDEGCRALAEGAPASTDSINLLQTGSPRVLRRHLTAADTARIFAKHDVIRRPPPGTDRLYLVRRLIDEGSRARALRLAVALPGEAERRVAFGLIDLASGHLDRGRASLAGIAAQRTHGEADLLAEVQSDSSSDEARFALLMLVREGALRPDIPPGFRQWVTSDPSASALHSAWERMAANDPAALEPLEPQLAALDARHPAFRQASRFRALWREARREPASAREALALLDPVIAVRAEVPDLMLRARLGAIAGDSGVVVSTLWDLLEIVESRTFTAVARDALGILDASKAQGSSVASLRARLSAVAKAGT